MQQLSDIYIYIYIARGEEVAVEDKPLGIKSGLKLRGFVTPITLCPFITWVAKDADKEVSYPL